MKRILLLAILVACHEAPPQGSKTANDVPAQPARTGDGGEPSPSPSVVAAPAAAAPAKPKPTKIRLFVKSIPPKALVTWGKKKLGPTPVQIDRPYGSGPMDLIVKSDGYFPVHTRAYTFKNNVVWVRLTKLTDKMALFGARQELEPSPSPAP
jgi:hypothetical protein